MYEVCKTVTHYRSQKLCDLNIYNECVKEQVAFRPLQQSFPNFRVLFSIENKKKPTDVGLLDLMPFELVVMPPTRCLLVDVTHTKRSTCGCGTTRGPHGITTQKTNSDIFTAVLTTNLTKRNLTILRNPTDNLQDSNLGHNLMLETSDLTLEPKQNVYTFHSPTYKTNTHTASAFCFRPAVRSPC
jgi:hypothetical protein